MKESEPKKNVKVIELPDEPMSPELKAFRAERQVREAIFQTLGAAPMKAIQWEMAKDVLDLVHQDLLSVIAKCEAEEARLKGVK